MKTLVAYFSTSGVTAKVAKKLANAIGADLYDICPAKPYTRADQDWTNKQSRSSVEMNDKSCRPKLLDHAAPVAGADVIFVRFPVWWYREPSIIDSFLEAYDFSGKKIIPFATSGGSDLGTEAPARMSEISGTKVLPGKRFASGVSTAELKAWADQVLEDA